MADETPCTYQTPQSTDCRDPALGARATAMSKQGEHDVCTYIKIGGD